MALFTISRIPSVIKWFYPSSYVWDKKSQKKTIYLTFDDGPVPEITDFVLDTLSRKISPLGTSVTSLPPIPATFFCIGDNVRKYPTIFNRIVAGGHAIGNHTYNHLKGTITDKDLYLKNTQLCELEMAKHLSLAPTSKSTTLFRPPYGRIKYRQSKALRELGYKIIMYRIVSFDWDISVSPEECLENVISKTRNGDIIVFHDSVKAFKNMRYALPKTIAYFEAKGFSFEKLY